METFEEYDYVELTVDVSPELRKGVRGTVLMVYPETGQDYEVEFLAPDGSTIGVETLNGAALTRAYV